MSPFCARQKPSYHLVRTEDINCGGGVGRPLKARTGGGPNWWRRRSNVSASAVVVYRPSPQWSRTMSRSRLANEAIAGRVGLHERSDSVAPSVKHDVEVSLTDEVVAVQITPKGVGGCDCDCLCGHRHVCRGGRVVGQIGRVARPSQESLAGRRRIGDDLDDGGLRVVAGTRCRC